MILLQSGCTKSVHTLSVSVFGLSPIGAMQLSLFDDLPKKEALVLSVDSVNKKWGEFTLISANMLSARDYVPDRIAFGGVHELEE